MKEPENFENLFALHEEITKRVMELLPGAIEEWESKAAQAQSMVGRLQALQAMYGGAEEPKPKKKYKKKTKPVVKKAAPKTKAPKEPTKKKPKVYMIPKGALAVPPGNNLAEQIKFLRTQSGQSQAEFAKDIGVPQGTISRVERGKPPKKKTLAKLFVAYPALQPTDQSN